MKCTVDFFQSFDKYENWETSGEEVMGTKRIIWLGFNKDLGFVYVYRNVPRLINILLNDDFVFVGIYKSLTKNLQVSATRPGDNW